MNPFLWTVNTGLPTWRSTVAVYRCKAVRSGSGGHKGEERDIYIYIKSVVRFLFNFWFGYITVKEFVNVWWHVSKAFCFIECKQLFWKMSTFFHVFHEFVLFNRRGATHRFPCVLQSSVVGMSFVSPSATVVSEDYSLLGKYFIRFP